MAEEEEEEMKGVASVGDLAIPTDVALDIFVRIPLGRQLFRLRLVCRSWNDLLRSPRFLQAWSQRFPNSCCFVMWPPPSYPPAHVNVHWRPQLLAYQEPLKTHLAAYFLENFRISNSGYWFELPLQWFDRGQSFEVKDDKGEYCVRAFAGGSAGVLVDILFPPYVRPYCSPMPPPIIRALNFLSGTYRYLPSPSSSNVIHSSFCMEHPYFKARGTGWKESYSGLMEAEEHALHVLPNYEDGNHYYVVMHITDERSLLVYDSKDPATWKLVACVPHEINDSFLSQYPLGLFENRDIFKGDFFLPVLSMNALFAYSVEIDEWVSVEVHFPTPCMTNEYPTIAKFEGGRILMVMSLSSEEIVRSPLIVKRALHGFGVWELKQDARNKGGYKWVEVARAPPTFTEVHEDVWHFYFNPHFIYTSTMICMTSWTHSKKRPLGGHIGIAGRRVSPLIYNLVTDSWFYMPPFKETLDFVGFFSFLPTSRALVL